MPDIFQQYEEELRKIIIRNSRKIRRIYEDSIDIISPFSQRITLGGKTFDLRKYPQLRRKIENLIDSMHGEIYVVTVNSIEESWDLANRKNDFIADKRLAGKTISQRARKLIYDPNESSLDAFITRKERGLNLSTRVWNLLEPHKTMLEAGLGFSIADGNSAKETASELKKYLVEPDRLFRRVRNAEGRLVLSRSAEAYHPGQGVYRSSYKNALRLVRTETNISHRSADYERWQTIPFVKGMEVRLSAAHPRYDICDPLAGRYPKDFKFTGWHSQCICYSVPVLMSDEEYSKHEDEILGIGTGKSPVVNEVRTTPAAFKKYVNDHAEQIKGWKSLPYWVKDNKDYVKL